MIDSTPPTPRPTPINPGIELTWERQTPLVVARVPACDGGPHHARHPPFPLPYLFASTIESIAGIGRYFWRKYQRSLTHLLYLEAQTRTWEAHLPPQFAAPDDGRWDASFGGCTTPRPHLLLAGSVRSLPHQDFEDLEVLLPPFDGVHVVIHPTREWVSLTCFLCADGHLHFVACDEILLDDCEQILDSPLERVWIADRL